MDLREFLRRAALHPSWWRLLFWVNLVGSAYGFWWYRNQLAATPLRYWPVVPDSPGSTLLFTLFLGLLLARGGRLGRRTGAVTWLSGWPALLAAVAFASNMKYGLWTAIVLPQAGIVTGYWTFDHIHLSLSHLGMWAQGLLYLHFWRPTPVAALAAWAWLLVQDWLDYWAIHTHPTLPAEELEPSVRWIAVALSLIWGACVTWYAVRRERRAAPWPTSRSH